MRPQATGISPRPGPVDARCQRGGREAPGAPRHPPTKQVALPGAIGPPTHTHEAYDLGAPLNKPVCRRRRRSRPRMCTACHPRQHSALGQRRTWLNGVTRVAGRANGLRTGPEFRRRVRRAGRQSDRSLRLGHAPPGGPVGHPGHLQDQDKGRSARGDRLDTAAAGGVRPFPQ